MITLVVGGIFFLLLMNDGGTPLSLTSLIVGDSGLGEEGNSSEGRFVFGNDGEVIVLDVPENDFPLDGREVDVKLALDSVPHISTQTKIRRMEVAFTDTSTKITVNGDKLELSNADEVTLIMDDVQGLVEFDRDYLSYGGEVEGFSVNGVSLISKGTIFIEFEDIDYKSISIEEIELENLEFERGDGSLEVSEKLKYSLEQDKVAMFYFNGKIQVEKATGSNLGMEGVARGISVSGALLSFNLK